MEVQINGVKQDVSSNSNVSSLLALHSISVQGIAVAVNGTVVPKTSWSTHVLQSEDKITIIQATQGG
jgi:sulfur carrier protein